VTARRRPPPEPPPPIPGMGPHPGMPCDLDAWEAAAPLPPAWWGKGLGGKPTPEESWYRFKGRRMHDEAHRDHRRALAAAEVEPVEVEPDGPTRDASELLAALKARRQGVGAPPPIPPPPTR
jgi:hypothetical protein